MRRLSHIRNIFCVKRLVARGVHGYTLLRSTSGRETKRQASDDVRKEYIVMKTCYREPLVMPASYAVMDEEEMMYVEGGSEYYNAATCKEKAKYAMQCINNYVSAMSSGTCTTGEYTAYSLAISMYSYQYKQYTLGANSGKGVDYYNPWKIVVR